MEGIARILSTKKLLPHQKQRLLNAGLRIVEADFINIEYRDADMTGLKSHLIFTSQNAVKSIVQHKNAAILKGKPCFCVGKKTKSLLEQNHFEVVAQTDHASDLASVIVEKYAWFGFTFFSGNLRRGDLPETLSENHIDFNEIEVYNTRLTPHKIKTPVEGILFFSPSGVRSYLEQNKIKNEACFCIGITTADALKDVTKNIAIANTPNIESVIVQVIKQFKNI